MGGLEIVRFGVLKPSYGPPWLTVEKLAPPLVLYSHCHVWTSSVVHAEKIAVWPWHITAGTGFVRLDRVWTVTYHGSDCGPGQYEGAGPTAETVYDPECSGRQITIVWLVSPDIATPFRYHWYEVMAGEGAGRAVIV